MKEGHTEPDLITKPSVVCCLRSKTLQLTWSYRLAHSKNSEAEQIELQLCCVLSVQYQRLTLEVTFGFSVKTVTTLTLTCSTRVPANEHVKQYFKTDLKHLT